MSQLKYWDGTAWVDAVIGAQGTTGPQGIIGTQGLTGTQGIQGVQGTTPTSTPLFAPQVAGVYYRPQYGVASQSLTMTSANLTSYVPMYFAPGTNLTKLAIYTSSTHSGTTNLRIGLFSATSDIKPGTLISEGTISATAASTMYTINISPATMNNGWYFLASNIQNASGTSAFLAWNYTSISSSFLASMLGFNTALTYFNNSFTLSENASSGFGSAASAVLNNKECPMVLAYV